MSRFTAFLPVVFFLLNSNKIVFKLRETPSGVVKCEWRDKRRTISERFPLPVSHMCIGSLLWVHQFRPWTCHLRAHETALTKDIWTPQERWVTGHSHRGSHYTASRCLLFHPKLRSKARWVLRYLCNAKNVTTVRTNSWKRKVQEYLLFLLCLQRHPTEAAIMKSPAQYPQRTHLSPWLPQTTKEHFFIYITFDQLRESWDKEFSSPNTNRHVCLTTL